MHALLMHLFTKHASMYMSLLTYVYSVLISVLYTLNSHITAKWFILFLSTGILLSITNWIKFNVSHIKQGSNKAQCYLSHQAYLFTFFSLNIKPLCLPPGWLSRIHLSMQEMWVLSLCKKDSLEKAMASHSSILAWKIP